MYVLQLTQQVIADRSSEAVSLALDMLSAALEPPMTDKKLDLLPPSEQRQAALSTWDDEGGAVPRPLEKTLSPRSN
jgi:hypothetical protein